jgi:hypothetical protein
MQGMRDIVYYYEYFDPHRVFYTINRFKYGNNYAYDRIWCQGPQGGVRIVSENWMSQVYEKNQKTYYGRKYVTKNEKAMREFAWVKLKAQPFEKEK